MNCPDDVRVFKHGLKSYETSRCTSRSSANCRYEPSGAPFDARARVQDDAHVFCTREQVTEECVKFTRHILDIYQDFGFEDVRTVLRPPERVGETRYGMSRKPRSWRPRSIGQGRASILARGLLRTQAGVRPSRRNRA